MTEETKQTLINAAIGAWCLVGVAMMVGAMVAYVHLTSVVVG